MKRAPKIQETKTDEVKREDSKKAGLKRAELTSVERAREAVFWLALGVVVAIPLAFTTSAYRIYSMPKYALLVTLSAAMLPLLAAVAFAGARLDRLLNIKESKHALVVALYFIVVSISTIFGVAPRASTFGSIYNQMGLVTLLSLFVAFLGLTVGIGWDEKRFTRALWAMGITGAVVAIYACMQFFGYDPYLPQSFYTMDSEGSRVVRVIGTIGHSNSLGNFLLYTTPIMAALAIGAKGERRWLMAGATLLSIAAIAFTGTRGAWLGFMAGAITFAALMRKSGAGLSLKKPRRLILETAIALAVVLIAVLAIALNPASGGILARARATVTEGFTGSGRTLLWRDALKMVPAYALTGTGPEGFRKAFLPYKSKELARLAPQTNNESSHNAYLDAAISFGLAGAILYAAIIVSSLRLLARARRQTSDAGLRTIFTGLTAALVGAAVHYFFIYDQISTGLYFFAVAALASVSARLASKTATAAEATARPAEERSRAVARLGWMKWPIAAVGSLVVAGAVWYSIGLIRADAAMARAAAAADRGDSARLVEEGLRAASGPDPAGDYDYLFARALAQCADRLQRGDRPVTDRERPSGERGRVIDLGIIHGERAVAHTLTPDASHLLLAYLALLAGDSTRLRENAAEAVRLDPHYASAHWLMSEAFMAAGDRAQAVREGKKALEINPRARNARMSLKRSRKGFDKHLPTVDERVAWGRQLAAEGRTDKAIKVLRRAVRRAKAPCPACHNALADVYESANLYREALAELEVFIQQTPDASAADEARKHMETLRQKAGASR